jgi:hypothetical protein
MADTKILSVNNDNPSSISFTLLAASLLPILYYLLNKKQRRDDSNVPWAPGRIPILGHALAYKQDPAQFLTDTCQSIGGMFQLNLAGKHMIIVCGPDEQRALANLPESKLSSRQAVADIGFEQTLGSFNVHHGTDLHKGIVKGVWHNQPSQIVTGWMEQLQQVLYLETSERHCHDFFQLLRRVVLRSVIELMIAPTFLEGYPTFLDEFMSFQDQLEDVTAKSVVLPRWIALPAMLWPLEKRRLKLQTKIEARLHSLLLDENVKKGFWLEQILETQEIPIISELVVGLLFAAHKNPAIGAAQSYLLLQEMGTPEDQDLCTKEAHRFLQSPDWHTLQSCQRLRRVCLETLRLTAHSIGAVRTAQQDIPVANYTIPKGASVGFAHIASSWNPELWKDPHHLDTTNRSGDLYQDEYKFTTFSHGVHKCESLHMMMNCCSACANASTCQLTYQPFFC